MKEQDDPIICRCEEIRRSEIEAAIDKGARTLKDVKNYTRAGMGLCQGKTCGDLVARIIAERLRIPREEVHPMRVRSPIRPIAVESLISSCDEE